MGSEMCIRDRLTLVSVMVAFADAVLDEIMPVHVAALRFLYTAQVIIMMGDDALPHLPLLEEILAAHHDLFLTLYADCQKPKLHYMRHLARLFRQFGKVLTCFGGERHHMISKRMASHCYRNMTSSLLRQSLVISMNGLRLPESFKHVKLINEGPIRMTARDSARHLLREFGLRGCARGRKMRACKCTLAKGEFVLYERLERGGEPSWAGGVSLEFWRTEDRGNNDYYVILEQYQYVMEATITSWVYRVSGGSTVVHHARILQHAPYFLDGDTARVVLPMYARQLFA